MADRNAPAVLYLVDITPHRIHEGAVVEPLHLAIGRRCEPCEPGAARRQHREACSRNSSPGPENLEGAPELEKNSLTAAVMVTSAVWEGNGMHSTDLVNWSTITRTNSLLHGARVPEILEISKGPADPE